MNNPIFLLIFAQTIDPSNLPQASVENSMASILKVVFMTITILSVIFVVWGGFKYTTSGGDPQGIASAKNTILYALIGLIIGISAFTITRFVAGNL